MDELTHVGGIRSKILSKSINFYYNLQIKKISMGCFDFVHDQK